METCYRHPDRTTGIHCQRCGQAICSECMRQAPVGFQCVTCVINAHQEHTDRQRTYHKQRQASSLDRQTMAQHMVSQPGSLSWSRHSVTITLAGLCVITYIVQMLSELVCGYDIVAQYGAFHVLYASIEPWRYVTSMFLHGGIMHLVFNVMALLMMGQMLEPILGKIRFAGLYMIAGIGGGLGPLIYALIYPQGGLSIFSVGASGAVFGLFGALFVVQRRIGVSNAGIIALLGINLVFGFIVPNISWQTHIAGMIVGALVVAMFFALARRPVALGKRNIYDSIISVVVALVMIGIMMWIPTVFFAGIW